MSDFAFRKKFSEQLSDLIEGDINLLEAIGILKRSFKGKKREKVMKLQYLLEKGKNLDEAFSCISTDKEFLSFVKTGEKTGDLKKCFKLLKEKYTFISQLKSEVISILIYPIMVILAAIVIFNVLLLLVVPKFIDIYQELGQNLPKITMVVINISNFLIKYRLMIAIFFVFLSGVIYFCILRQKSVLDRLLYKVGIVRLYILLSFTQNMYASFSSGIEFLEALKLSMNTDNIVFRNELNRIYKRIEKGDSINYAFNNSSFFDEEYKSYIIIADMTADLSKTFNTLTVILNNRLRYKVKIYLKFLEPISILIIAIFVGLIVLAIMLPLFNLGENLT